ncbi:MAG: glycosyltransferase [Alphaproteobacteria bacterium]|nr:glycosyltransferase [Alphaproteobacteria bacterium]MCW5738689.1 glycosyltransferase [Alphaproteobacteria bacterium]
MPSPPAHEEKILVLEPDSEGHSQEWLRHLIDFVAAGELHRLEIVAPASLCDALRPALVNGAHRRIALSPLSPAEHRMCTHRRLVASGFARWWVMRRHLRRSGARSGFFLSIDHLSLPLAFGLGASGARLSGILFRPSVHYGVLGAYEPTRAERLRDLRKALLYRLMLRNPAVDSVLSLDPYFPGYAMSHYAGGEKVRALPDPAHAASQPAGTEQFAGYAPAGRIGLLLFGYLARRKGPLELLEALGRLRPQTAARVAVMLAGRVDPPIGQELEARRQALAHAQPSLWLQIADRRLDSAEIDSLIQRSGVVLAPYQRFVGSSGVLLWAARAGRPVLTQDFGLIGRLTRDHGLGLVTDSTDPACLAFAIEHIVESGGRELFDVAGARRFVASHTPEHFAAMVMSGARLASH